MTCAKIHTHPTPCSPNPCVQRSRLSDALDVDFQPLHELTLRPENFDSFLCDTLGFRLLRRLEPSEAAEGFHRSILVLRRP